MARLNRRDRWTARVIKSSLPSGTRLFLATVLASKMRANGKVSFPRAKMAAALGVDERTISRHVQKAREAGWLVVVHGGYRGRVAEYEATFPNEERVTTGVTLSEARNGQRKGDSFYHPLWVTDLSPFPPRKGDDCCPAKVGTYVPTGTPEQSDQFASPQPRNDAWNEDASESVNVRGRGAPTAGDLIRAEIHHSHSGPRANRHLHAVPA